MYSELNAARARHRYTKKYFSKCWRINLCCRFDLISRLLRPLKISGVVPEATLSKLSVEYPKILKRNDY